MRTFVTALPIAALYALVGASVVIVYRSTRIVNFAVGELVVLAGYGTVTVYGLWGAGMAAPIVLVASIVLGILFHRFFIRPVLGSGPVVGVLITVGMAIFLRSAIVGVFGGRIHGVPATFATSVALGPFGFVRLIDIIVVAVTGVVFLLLGWMFSATGQGRQMRASAERPLLASQRGIDVNRVSALAWAVALAVAGVAGVLVAFRLSMSVPVVIIGIKGIAAALIGGLDSLRGALLGAFLLAIVEALATQQVDARASDAVPFVVLLIVLLVRPWGLLGSSEDVERV